MLLFVLILCDILLYPLDTCLFSNWRQRGGGSGWDRRLGGTRRCRGRENSNQIYYVRKKSLFSIKGKGWENKIKNSV